MATKVAEVALPPSWQFYPLVASASLLLTLLILIIMRYIHSRSELVQHWTRRVTGKPPKEEMMLLHTLPYYLAITRSSCEVGRLFFRTPLLGELSNVIFERKNSWDFAQPVNGPKSQGLRYLRELKTASKINTQQAHILDLPMGHKISNNANNNAVKFGNLEWQLNSTKRWKTWVSLHRSACLKLFILTILSSS